MKQFVILCCYVLSLSGFYGQTPDRRIIISHLSGDFYIYTTYGSFKGNPVPSNSMYMLTSEGAVLFDTPWDSTQFQPLLDSIKIRHNKVVILCISTHFHEDRTAGLEFYSRKGIKTYTTARTDGISKLRNERRAEFLIYSDTVFTVGRHTFQTYYGGEGHTPDNIVIWFNQEKILYGGCLVKSTEAKDLGNLGDANVKEWAATIRNVQKKFKDPAYIIPGHWDWQSKTSLTHTLNLIRKYEKENYP